MTNPGEDAGQTASSGATSGASEPTSGGSEAPPIEQSTHQTGTQAEGGQTSAPFEPPDQSGYISPAYGAPYEAPSGYDPSAGYSPSYSPPPSYPPPPSGAYPPPTYPPPSPSTYPPPYSDPSNFGQSYPPPPYGASPYGASSPYGSPAGYGAPGYAGGYGVGAPKTNPLAIASLVCSIVSLCGIGSLAGIVLGIVALNQINDRNEGGRGLAIAGIAVGAVTLVLSGLWFVGMVSSS